MRRRLGYGTLYAKRSPSDWRGGSNAQRSCVPATALRTFWILRFDVKLSKFPSANLAPKIELKWATNLENRGQGGGTPSDFGTKNGPNFDLGCSCGSWAVLVASWECLGGRFGTVLSGSWVPTWVPKWSQLGQKIDPKIDHFLNASWNRFLRRFWWILGAKMEPSWHQNGIKHRYLRKHEKTYLELAR